MVKNSGRDSCRPGDITLRPIHGGYILGRVVRHEDHGPWWEYIKIIPDRGAAIDEARRLAFSAHARLWFHEGGDLSQAVPLDLEDALDPPGRSRG